MAQQITITRPDDWHLHLRDGAVLKDTVPASAKIMGRAIIMPNLVPPVMDAQQALEYRARIMAQSQAHPTFNPLMVIYLTDNTTPEIIREAALSGHVVAAKLYPAGATTNSDSGVTDLSKLADIAAVMAEYNMPLLVHGEVTSPDVDVFDREKRFLDDVLDNLVEKVPSLRLVVEHITTKDAAQFVLEHGNNIGATITPQHLAYNRNHMLVGGIKPHYYCLPILKRNIHQQALRDVVSQGDSSFFLGTDSAPHAKSAKENACGCAGCFTAYAAIELYAEIFDELGALNHLESFASFNGPDFYKMARNTDTITLQKTDWIAPQTMQLGDDVIVPLRAGETLKWQLV